MEFREAERERAIGAQTSLKQRSHFEKTKVQLGTVEKDNLMVCRGRLEYSHLEPESRLPIILPHEHRLTQLIGLYCHERMHNLRVRAILAELRSSFWVTKGRQFVKKVLKPCLRCKFLDGKVYNARIIAALPSFRVTL